jgi:hypothetical protein
MSSLPDVASNACGWQVKSSMLPIGATHDICCSDVKSCILLLDQRLWDGDSNQRGMSCPSFQYLML